MKDNPYILSPAERDAITWIRTVARALVPAGVLEPGTPPLDGSLELLHDAFEMVAASLESGCHAGGPVKTLPVAEVFGSRWEKPLPGQDEPSFTRRLYVDDVVTHHGTEHHVVQDCPENGGAILRNVHGATVQAGYADMLLVRRAPGRTRSDLPWADRPIDTTITRVPRLPPGHDDANDPYEFTVPAPGALRLADLSDAARVIPKSRPSTLVIPEQTWYAFECGSSLHSVMLDVRLDSRSEDPPLVACPLCAAPMNHRGTWPATENGFGGLPDDLNNVLHYARRAADLHGDEYPACQDLGQAIDAFDAATRAKTPKEMS